MKTTKRLLSVLLALIMVVGIFPISVFATGAQAGLSNFDKKASFKSSLFDDVSKDDWYYDNVKAAYEFGIMEGKGAGSFGAGKNITLAEAVTIAARLHSIYYTGEEDFEKSDPWYQVYVDYAEENEIVAFDEGADLGRNATRAEFAAILASAFPSEALEAINKVADGGIPDVDTDDTYAVAIYKLYRAGVLTGSDDEGTFKPNTSIKRREVAAIVSRMADASLRKSITLAEKYTVTFISDGTILKTVEVFEGDYLASADTPEKSGYKFGGWLVGSENGEKFDAFSKITSDLTLYASWTKNTTTSSTGFIPLVRYAVTFNAGADDVTGMPAMQLVFRGGKVTEPTAPSREGYTFTGWYTDASCTTLYDFARNVSAKLELYAGWVNANVKYTVSFDLNYEGAVNAPEEQNIEPNGYATTPDEPVRDGYVFMGWHKNPDENNFFNFKKTVIDSNVTIYAHWVDITDTTDTDGDGLTDPFELYYGTDVNNIDTDGDGLNDYYEIISIGTDPLKKDTDGDGVTDDLEDADSDKLTNIEEYNKGTNPIYNDTDHDSLSDYDEIYVYGTDPLNPDTDGDGVTDGDEVSIGSDPLTAETSFTTQSGLGEPDENNPVTIKVDAVTDSNGAGTLQIDTVSHTDNYLVSEFVAGYLGSAFDLTSDGVLESATLTFSYDKSLGTIGDDFQPRIYYLNETTGEYEELPNQTVTDGQVTAETTHFSTYILLNKVEFDSVWDAEIKPPIEEEEKNGKDHLDVVLVIDSSGSMTSNDRYGIRKTVAKNFVSKLGEKDRAAIIDFDSSASLYSGFTSDKNALNTAINRIDSYGGTNLGRGINLAISQFSSSSSSDSETAYKYIIMLTDGDGSYDTSLTKKAKSNDIVIYTIGLGNEVRDQVLKSMADGTGGKYYFATMAENLNEIFDVVIEETIDYTTDSNEDGISDYFTKLINDGTLRLSNSSDELSGCTDIFGEDCAD